MIIHAINELQLLYVDFTFRKQTAATYTQQLLPLSVFLAGLGYHLSCVDTVGSLDTVTQ